MLVLHYTGMTTARGCARAPVRRATAKVSSHYLVHEDGRIDQLVPEARRAWHAGVSSWDGETDINSRSIGIEIVNPGHEFGYPDFPEAQIDAVIALCRDIVARHTIRPDRVLAHSDVAPARKNDPGEKFPWARLAACRDRPLGRAGADRGRHRTRKPAQRGEQVAELQRMLARYGYGSRTSRRTTTRRRATSSRRSSATSVPRASTASRMRRRCETLRAAVNGIRRACLIWPRKAPRSTRVSRPDGRSCLCRKVAREESPGSMDMRCRITSGGESHAQARRSQGQCHREQTARRSPQGRRRVRVKRCGKSAPRLRQRRRQGKPHREQNRIGTARASARKQDVRDLCPGLVVRVGCSRRRATGVPEEWPSRGGLRLAALQNPAYRPADM